LFRFALKFLTTKGPSKLVFAQLPAKALFQTS
jgi:hypothetical protein